MTIILFLVDTSSSMCQKAYVNGVQKSYLDIAKGAVETFLKYRQRTQDCLGDRYMLLTFEEPPANVKAGWKENHATFMNELKNLQSYELTSMGESLKNAFDLLNLNRMQSGIDTYGQGRCPFYLEPSVIIVITDGGRYSYRNGVHQEIILPLNTQIPGTKFTKEPFRWDQRLFSLVLRMPGNKIDERVEGKVPHDDSPIERMCEVTGGRSYRVKSHYVLNQCIESLVQKVQPGVVLQFEPMLPKDIKEGGGEIQDIAFQTTKKMIYVQKHISQKTFPMGYWPLPEPYWPDPKAVTLPPRDAHPKLRIVMPAVDEPQMVRSFPVDKYEIEASPLTLQILSKREMNKCWPVIIANGMHGFEVPFGYLKASPNFTQVHLYVLAYNYTALLPLLHDLIHKYNMSPPNELMYKFNAYVRSIPPYYCPFLRKALLNINVPYPLLQFLLPENVDNYLSPNIANQLKHIKNTAKQDQENLCIKVYKQLKQPKPPYRQVETAKLNCGQNLRRDLVRNPLLRDTFTKLHAEIEPLDNYTIVVPSMTRQASAKNYRNPFDIPRRDLIDEIGRMREAFLRSGTGSVIKDSGHCLPISEMGNYQEYLKNKDNPLREIEPTNVRQHMFGNPYKKDKHMVMVDEADLSDVAPIKSNAPNTPKKIDASRARKRKAGPIRRDYIFRRTSTDVRPCTPALSSSSSMSGSDFEDDSGSETSSIVSEDSDSDRLVVGFDFNEPVEEFPINGHVRNFINGITDDSSDESSQSSMSNNLPSIDPSILSSSPAPSMQIIHNTIVSANSSSSSISSSSSSSCNSGQTFSGGIGITSATCSAAITVPLNTSDIMTCTPSTTNNSSIPHQLPILAYSPMSMSDLTGPSTSLSALAKASASKCMSLNTAQQTNGNIINSQATTTTHATAVAAAFHHNDISDAQEISRILQQCHNGKADVIPEDDGIAKIDDAAPKGLSSLSSSAPQIKNVNFDDLKKEDSIASTSNNHHRKRNHCSSLSPQPSPSPSPSPSHSPSPAPSEEPLTDEQRESMRKHNLEMRTTIFKDIRRPGRDYTQLLDNLNLIKGDNEMKSNFIQMCIVESMRFRRKMMASSIQEWWDKKQQLLKQEQQTHSSASS